MRKRQVMKEKAFKQYLDNIWRYGTISGYEEKEIELWKSQRREKCQNLVRMRARNAMELLAK